MLIMYCKYQMILVTSQKASIKLVDLKDIQSSKYFFGIVT